jgi:asparagine synthase (glutamine-hydrolysing)
MCEAIVHRGPSSEGAFCRDGVGLGVRRLAVIDLETGDQPIFNEDESVVVVLNGEIYNYVELRAELEARGHRFRTRTDTEVIVHLYEDHGRDCVHRLRGMFAFALWDRREERLLLARDRLGKKPLFYAVRNGSISFASEPRALFRDPTLPRAPDARALDAYLQLGYVPAPMSAFEGVRKLLPAHTLSWQAGRIETNRYWRLSYADRHAGASYSDLKSLVRDALLDATRLRLRSDVPLGAFLSGGVDSAAVVAAMAAERRVRTFTIGFDVESHDEARYAARVASIFGTDHEELTVEPDAVSVLPRLVWHYGEPFADPSAVPTFLLSELAASRVTVALNGDGGDESFGGYSRYRFHDVVRRFEATPRPLADRTARALRALGERGPALRPLRQARWLAEALTVPPALRYANTMAHVRLDSLDRLYSPEFRQRVGEERFRADEAFAEAIEASDAESSVERLMDLDVQTYLPGDLLVKVDIASMAHSLEVRSPLLDHELMELAAGLPMSAKLKGATGKRILKDVLREWLPDDLVDRPKQGFSPPLAAWLRGPLAGLTADVLFDPATRDRGLFEEAALRGLVEDHRSGAADNSTALWTLLQLELWFRTYVDADGLEPLADLGVVPA